MQHCDSEALQYILLPHVILYFVIHAFPTVYSEQKCIPHKSFSNHETKFLSSTEENKTYNPGQNI